MELQPSEQESSDERVVVASSEGRASVPFPAMAWIAEYIRGLDRGDRLWFEHPRSHDRPTASTRMIYLNMGGEKKE